MQYATCHPDRQRMAHGMCQPCYNKWYRTNKLNPSKAKCHPDRPLEGRGMCKQCYNAWYRDTKPEKRGEWHRRKKAGLPTYTRTRQNPSVTKARKRVRASIRHLERMYGLSESDYDELLHEQEEACAACKTHVSKLNKRLSVDHCHRTGIVRGLLCNNCNLAIGYAKDSVVVLSGLLAYLCKHSTFDKPDKET